MQKVLKTKNHLTTCSANFSRLRKILRDFEKDHYTFEVLNSEEKNKAEDFDKAAEDLRLSTRHLGMIVGKVDVEEILGSIFNDFCIGK